MGRLRPVFVASVLMSTVLLTGGTVSYFEEALPSTMNPLFAQSMVEYRTHELVFDRLYFRSAVTNEPRSRLVESFERLDNNRRVRLNFHEGIRWHDGQPFTAEDVCFTVDAMLNPRTASPVAASFRESIAGCEVVPRENAAIIAFRRTYHNPLDHLGFSVLPKHVFNGNTVISPDSDFATRPVGTGPMRGSRGRREVRFEAFPNPHQNAKIRLMSLGEGGDPLVQVRTIINAGVQGLITVAPPQRPEIAASDEVTLRSYDLRSWWFIALNTNRGALSNKSIRQALNVTLDRSELRELTIGVDPNDPHPPCEFVSGPFVQSSPYYNRQVPVVERSDRAKARRLMQAAGASEQAGRWIYNDRPISLRIGMHSPLDAEARDLLNQVGNQLQAGGFDRQVYRISADDWQRTVMTGQATDYDMLIGKWSFGLVEDVNPLFHSRGDGKGTLNLMNYSNAEVDKILGRFESARTDTEARDAYHDLHEYLAEDLPYLFLWKLDTKSAWRNEIRRNLIAPYFYFTEFENWTYELGG